MYRYRMYMCSDRKAVNPYQLHHQKKYLGSDFMLLCFFASLALLTHVTLFHHNVSNTPADGVKSVPNHHRVPTRLLNCPHSPNPQITS